MLYITNENYGDYTSGASSSAITARNEEDNSQAPIVRRTIDPHAYKTSVPDDRTKCGQSYAEDITENRSSNEACMGAKTPRDSDTDAQQDTQSAQASRGTRVGTDIDEHNEDAVLIDCLESARPRI